MRSPRAAPYDSRGESVPLGARLGRGGEGTVFEVVGAPGRAAKIYHRALPREHEAKLRAMVALHTERLGKLAAWPLGTLHARPGGPVVGLLMPRVSGKPIHLLYGPKSRLRSFPNAHWGFLLHTATNLARAFAVVHEHGHVVGDVNHGNVLVTGEATVSLIDCDSFQVTDGDRTFLCGVGVATHLAPELQGRSLRVRRQPNHDAFGLAVLLFQLLFLGRHPFSGRYLGVGDMPIERAIAELLFAYGSAAAAGPMRPPPNSPRLTSASPAAALLFERAFDRQGMAGGRPTAREWVTTLKEVARHLAICGRKPTHQYPSLLPSCPWCDLEDRSGLRFFGAAAAVQPLARSTFDLARIWAQIQAAADAGRYPPYNSTPHPTPVVASRQAVVVRRLRIVSSVVLFLVSVAVYHFIHQILRQYTTAIAWAVSVFGFGYLWIVSPGRIGPYFIPWELTRLEREWQLSTAQTRLDKLESVWGVEASDRAFERKVLRLETIRREYAALEAHELNRRKEIETALLEGLDDLQQILDRRRSLAPELEAARQVVAQAVADLKAMQLW